MEEAVGSFTLTTMMDILRNEEKGICRVGKSGSATTGSQVSVLCPPGGKISSHHWLTATPNPRCSVFKPFVFCSDVRIGTGTMSPTYGDEDPAKVKPRFQKQVDRKHPLYKEQENIKPLPGDEVDSKLLDTVKSIENLCVHDLQEYLAEFGSSKPDDLKDLFKDAVESEIRFYED